MDTSKELIGRTENLLAQVQSLQKLMEALGHELRNHEEALRTQLSQLQSDQAPPAPAAPEAEPPRRRRILALFSKSQSPPPAPAAAPPAKASHGKERRASLRRKGNPVSVQVTNATGRTDPYSGWIVDRSLGGVCILIDEEFPVGTLLSIRPTQAPESFPWVQTAVKSCRQERSSYKLGLQFLQSVTWEELRVFG